MAVVAITFDGTRVNDSTSSTNWGNWGSSGGAPAAESPLAYQGGLVVNKKINSSTLGGIDYDPGTGAVDMTSATRKLWFIKALVADSFDLDTAYGVSIGIGSSNADYYQYNMAGSGANNDRYLEYPVQGGYLITALDPEVAQWRESTTGTPVLTAVDWFGVQADFIVGAAKAENLALDAIDIGTGLTLVGGDGADPDGAFTDFVDVDQGNSSNRWGVVIGAGNAVRAHGLLTIGSATATVFTDSTSVVTFPDGYHSAGLVGVLVNLASASTVVTMGSLLIGEGRIYGADDTRPDFTVTGTSGSATITAQMRNFRNVTFTSACTVEADIECAVLSQGSANLDNSTIRTNQGSTLATLTNPTYANIEGVSFVQSGSGHAIREDTPGTYSLTDITFSGYGGTPGSNLIGGSGAGDAAFFNASGGAITLNVTGGNSPSVRNSAGATTTVVSSVLLVFDGIVSGSRLYIEAATGGPLSAGTVIYNEIVTLDPLTISYGFVSNQPVIIRVRKASATPLYEPVQTTGTITSAGLSVVINQILDE